MLLRHYQADGTAVGADISFASGVAGSQGSPNICMLAEGGYVVVWAAAIQNDDGDICLVT